MSLREFISNESFEASAPEVSRMVNPQGSGPAATVHITVEQSPEMDTAAKGVEDTDGQMKALQDATVALEAYSALLHQYRDTGINQASAQLMYLGLEQHQAVLQTAMAERPSLEAFGSTASRSHGVKVSIAGIEVDLHALAVKIRELLKKAGQMAVQLFHELTRNVEGLQSKLADYKKQLSSVSINAGPSHNRIPVKHARLLFVGNEFVGQDPSRLMEVAKILVSDYPIAADNYLAKLAQILNRYPGTSARECWREMMELDGPADQYSVYKAGKQVLYPGDASFATRVGSRRDDARDFDRAGDAANSNFGQGLVLTYTKSNDRGDEFELQVVSRGELLQRIAQFERLFNLMATLKSSSGKLDTGFNKLTTALEQFDKKATGKDDELDAEKLIRALGKLNTITGGETSKAYSYLWRAAGAFLAVLDAEINEYT